MEGIATHLRKITVKDIMRGYEYEKTEPQDLFLVWGVVRDARTEESTYKDASTGKPQQYFRYFGDIRAKRLVDQAEFKSTQMILDNFTADILHNAFLFAKSENENADVPFAFIIGVEPFQRGEEKKHRHTMVPIDLSSGEVKDPLEEVKQRLIERLPPTAAAALGYTAPAALTDQSNTGKAKATA